MAVVLASTEGFSFGGRPAPRPRPLPAPPRPRADFGVSVDETLEVGVALDGVAVELPRPRPLPRPLAEPDDDAAGDLVAIGLILAAEAGEADLAGSLD